MVLFGLFCQEHIVSYYPFLDIEEIDKDGLFACCEKCSKNLSTKEIIHGLSDKDFLTTITIDYCDYYFIIINNCLTIYQDGEEINKIDNFTIHDFENKSLQVQLDKVLKLKAFW